MDSRLGNTGYWWTVPTPPLPPVASAHHDTMAYAAFITLLDTVHPLPPLMTWLIVPSVISYERQPSGKRRKTKGGGALFLRDETEICLLHSTITITFNSFVLFYFCILYFVFLYFVFCIFSVLFFFYICWIGRKKIKEFLNETKQKFVRVFYRLFLMFVSFWLFVWLSILGIRRKKRGIRIKIFLPLFIYSLLYYVV